MERLQTRFLNIALDAVLHPVSSAVQRAVQHQQNAANMAKPIEENELSAQEWFEKGIKETATIDKIHCYTQAILLKPDYANAYDYRGSARIDRGDLDEAIEDFTKAIQLEPKSYPYYEHRGAAFEEKKEYRSALADYQKAMDLAPQPDLGMTALRLIFDGPLDAYFHYGKGKNEIKKKIENLRMKISGTST